MTADRRQHGRLVGWHRRRGLALSAVAVSVVALALTGCGATTASHQSVAVGRAPATRAPAAGRTPTRTSSAPATCRPAQLRADQVPVSSGTGQSYLAWSLTNTATTTCVVPAGQPSLAFAGATGADVIHYAVSRLPNASGASARAGAGVTVAPGHAAWFLTEESTTDCGTGTVVAGGPFHYVVGLPGGAGEVTWTASYLSGSTLTDFCASVALGVGAVQSTAPQG